MEPPYLALNLTH